MEKNDLIFGLLLIACSTFTIFLGYMLGFIFMLLFNYFK